MRAPIVVCGTYDAALDDDFRSSRISDISDASEGMSTGFSPSGRLNARILVARRRNLEAFVSVAMAAYKSSPMTPIVFCLWSSISSSLTSVPSNIARPSSSEPTNPERNFSGSAFSLATTPFCRWYACKPSIPISSGQASTSRDSSFSWISRDHRWAAACMLNMVSSIAGTPRANFFRIWSAPATRSAIAAISRVRDSSLACMWSCRAASCRCSAICFSSAARCSRSWTSASRICAAWASLERARCSDKVRFRTVVATQAATALLITAPIIPLHSCTQVAPFIQRISWVSRAAAKVSPAARQIKDHTKKSFSTTESYVSLTRQANRGLEVTPQTAGGRILDRPASALTSKADQNKWPMSGPFGEAILAAFFGVRQGRQMT